MPQKILRLGFTEVTLLFYYWLEYSDNNHKHIINSIIKSKQNLIKWLYTTSGYYDNTIDSDYMDATHKDDIDPDIYKKYFSTLYEFIKNSLFIFAGAHYDITKPEFKSFYDSLGVINYRSHDIFYDTIKNNKILIISPFAKLFKIQYENGNCHKIYNNFPIINKFYYYTNIYTFFNKGPHNNILETSDWLVDDIRNTIEDDYDIVIISVGAYSNILASKFYDLNKHVYTMGGELPIFFGISNARHKYFLGEKKIDKEEYWIINIPDEYKPDGYMKIENGCYW